jgi:5-methylcytosine-specific restriction endonuclease McrA
MKHVLKPGAPWTLHELRRRAYHAQKGLCYWCKQPMRFKGPQNHPQALTADHLVPRYAGGVTKPGNIVAACYKCNSERQVETNLPRKDEAVWRAGDDTPVSPFAKLKHGNRD